jgi:hypothetical protein
MNTYFPEPASMFFHFEPDNNFPIRCIQIFISSGPGSYEIKHSDWLVTGPVLFSVQTGYQLQKYKYTVKEHYLY